MAGQHTTVSSGCSSLGLQQYLLLHWPILTGHRRPLHKGQDLERQSLPTEQEEAECENGEQTFFYLAYGSNLASSTFRGSRGIKPLSSINVVVPSLRLTFDLPGIPYSEPCFANSGLRTDPRSPPPQSTNPCDEKSPLLPEDYHKDRWQKGLVGVVYELTPEDFYHVIATEGGGASYNDIVVDAFPLRKDDVEVPWDPKTTPVRAHTLFAPANKPPPPPEKPPPYVEKQDGGDRYTRPDPSYAQPSDRYINLLRTGAMENGLPQEYRDFLNQIRPYRTTTQRQRMGQFIFGAVWQPLILTILSLVGMFSNKKGRIPQWLVTLLAAVFIGVWSSYDSFFYKTFGDGERTIGDNSDN